jgi:hypothetical protein
MRHRITYTGDSVVRLEGVGNFMNGTSAFVEEEQARAAKKIPGFVVEGLSDEHEPVRAPSKSRDERRAHLVEVPPEPKVPEPPELKAPEPKAPEPKAVETAPAKVAADA